MARKLKTISELARFDVVTALEAEEAVSELLFRVFGVYPVSLYNPELNKLTVTVYTAPETAFSTEKSKEVKQGLEIIRSTGLTVDDAQINVSLVKKKDWAEAWKLHFKPIKIGKSLLIKASWHKIEKSPGVKLVTLDPGLAFGTGQHPTTRFCLRQIVKYRKTKKSFFDIGTGSGILAISAAKLGYSPVYAIDNDPDAVSVARKNILKNNVSKSITLAVEDLLKLPIVPERKFDLICANLTSDLLISAKDKILSHLSSDGVLVVAGILKTQFTDVVNEYSKQGFTLKESAVEGEWQSGSLVKL